LPHEAVVERQRNNLLNTALFNWCNARWAGFVMQKAVNALDHKAFLPSPYAGLRLASHPHDRMGAVPGRRQDDDTGPPNMFLG